MRRAHSGSRKALETGSAEKGQILIEYALVLLLIAMVVILMLTGVGLKTNNMYSTVLSSIPS